jgi:hypothetical protein
MIKLGRATRRDARSLLVALLGVALLGCSVEGPPGASDDLAAPDVSGVPLVSPEAPSEAPPPPHPSLVAMPADLTAVLTGLPFIERIGASVAIRRLGSGPVQATVKEDAHTSLDLGPGGPTVTAIENDGSIWSVFDIDVVSGARRLIVAIPTDGDLAADRDPSNTWMLVGNLGVDLVDIATGERRQLIEAKMPPELEGGTLRRFSWSPSGRTAATTICSIEVCVVDIIDAADWSVRRVPEPMSLQALTDDYALIRTSLDDRRPRLLDLATFESRPVAAEHLATLIMGRARDDGGLVAYGATSWRPYVHPVHRPLILVDPLSGQDRVLVDQGPEGWAYPLMEDWTNNNWEILTPELGDGGKPGVQIAVDTRTGQRYEFMIDDEGRAIAP